MGLGDGRIGEDFEGNYTNPNRDVLEPYWELVFEGLDADARREEYEVFMREEIHQIDAAQNSLTRRPDVSREQAIANMRAWYKKKKVSEKVGEFKSSVSVGAMNVLNNFHENISEGIREQVVEKQILVKVGKKGLPLDQIQEIFGEELEKVLRTCVASVKFYKGEIEAGVVCFDSLLTEMKSNGSLDDTAYLFSVNLYGEMQKQKKKSKS